LQARLAQIYFYLNHKGLDKQTWQMLISDQLLLLQNFLELYQKMCIIKTYHSSQSANFGISFGEIANMVLHG